MILELVEIRTKPGSESVFADGMTAALPLFQAAPGCHGIEVVRSKENPQTFFCLVKWDSVEDHTEKFQKSPAYETLFGLIGEAIDGGVAASHCDYVVSEAGMP
ncbi:antibiotic biosynthesis monooxygenase family protein [Salipiger abyssi]|uniref:Putative enzyme involved in biosynthesis of extracellular polysaccharides n=1 Tax=Salipiger abyssi TaxID=1250539 RepID=A0A1P8UWT4_9RHOB|nr:antibiotic biosynthesis monooxygenase family protein [Salipiger abyssi]APZ53864.1 putative enzyme involved in biosynthesis of extracellular polysaccharides [Salipiger abyssi]